MTGQKCLVIKSYRSSSSRKRIERITNEKDRPKLPRVTEVVPQERGLKFAIRYTQTIPATQVTEVVPQERGLKY